MAKKKKAELSLEERLEQALVPVDEQPYEVPGNWCWTRLNIVSEVVTGSTPSKTKMEYYGNEFPFFKPADLDAGRNTIIASEYLSKEGKEVSRIIPPGSTAVCCIGSIGKSGYLEVEGTTNQQINSVIPKINPLYLYYYINTDTFINELWEKSSATTISIINKSKMESNKIAVPPLAEQQRIVEQIESLFAKLDEAKDKVLDALDGFDSRKNAVLYKAFSGELSQTWRESNKVIKDTWSTVLLKELIVSGPQNGMYKEKSAYGDGTKILRIDGFYDGYIVAWDKLKRLTLNDEELEWYRLNVNDIVINRVNSMPYLGKSALVRELPEECVYESNMMRIKIDESKVYPEYLIKYLNSMMGLQELRKNAKQAVNQASINQQDVKNVKVILPSLKEQIEIVRLLELFTDEEVEAKERIESVIEQIDLMKKSILAKAFRGELGTNNPDEESSVELLKSIFGQEE